MNVAAGSYSGSGAATSVAGLGFTPLAVIIKARSGAHNGQITISGMGANNTQDIAQQTAFASGRITSLDSDGFSLGTDTTTNGAGVIYDWLALGSSGATDIHVGTYTGTGVGARGITGVGFQPNVVLWTNGNSGRPQWFSSDMTANHLSSFGNVAEATSQGVASLDSDGFTIGTNNGINQNAITFYYLALKSVTGVMKPLTYTGTGVAHDITGAGFQPDNAWVKDISQTAYAVFRGKNEVGDVSAQLDTSNTTTLQIQAFVSDGITVGTAGVVNNNTIVYFAVVFKSNVSGGVATYTTFGLITREHDTTKNAPVVAYYFEATLLAPATGSCFARLYNVTTGAVVSGSTISTAATTATRVRSSAITLATGSNVYRAEFGGAVGATFTCYAADIIADVT